MELLFFMSVSIFPNLQMNAIMKIIIDFSLLDHPVFTLWMRIFLKECQIDRLGLKIP